MSVSEDDRVSRPSRGKSSRSSRNRNRRRRRGGLGRLFYWLFVLSIWGVVAVGAVVGYFGAKMPSANTWEIPDRAPNVRIVAEDGSLLANRGLTGGEAMGLREMSPYIPQAVVAIEDRRYYSHFGFDPIGFGRGVDVQNVR